MFASLARDLHLGMVAHDVAGITGLPDDLAQAALYAAADPYWRPAALLEATAQLEAALGGQDSTHPIVAAFWKAVRQVSNEQGDGEPTQPLENREERP